MSFNLFKTVGRFSPGEKKIKNIINSTLKALRKQDHELSLHLVGDKRMLSLNKKFLGINKTTDVLAFAAQEGATTPNRDLGDIFVSIPQIKRQARSAAISYKEEFARILVHGLLHLLGFDHYTKRQEKEMFGLQERLVKKLKN